MPNPTEIRTPRHVYSREKVASLARWLRAPLPPTLVFSDTHFVPRALPWSDDAPDDLLALIDTLNTHELISLGDLTESVGLGARDRDALFGSPRLLPLWERLRARKLRLRIGNHDVRAEASLRAYFGEAQILGDEYSLGDIRVRHGHECEPKMTELVRHIGPWAVPIYERIFQRMSRGPERLPNLRVLEHLRGDARFVLFGHTHARGMEIEHPERAWANPGCFLRSAQSFLLIDGMEMALYAAPR